MARKKSAKKAPAPEPTPERAIMIIEAPPNTNPHGGRTVFWLTSDRIKAFEALLEGGGTDRDACERLGLSQGSFYSYLQTGRAMLGLEAMPKQAPQSPASRALCLDFLEAVTRARATARLKAISAVMSAVEGATSGERTTVTYSETILDRQGYPVIDPETKLPLMYVKQTITEKFITHAPDPRAGIEYLARRDRADWNAGNVQQAATVPFEEKAVAMIKAGSVDYESLMGTFHDEALVLSWFELAGIEPVIENK